MVRLLAVLLGCLPPAPGPRGGLVRCLSSAPSGQSPLQPPALSTGGGGNPSESPRRPYQRIRLHGAEWKDDPSWAQPLSADERRTALADLHQFLTGHSVLNSTGPSAEGIVVISGAGCSTASGIPDYRGPQGSYRTGHKPTSHQEFVSHEFSRQRYWARSMVGWDQMDTARPNRAHTALSLLEGAGVVSSIITQNVDGLHQRAGSKSVVDLHGRTDRVKCLNCGDLTSRGSMQKRLHSHNPNWQDLLVGVEARADGDAELQGAEYERFNIPACQKCGGVLKPDVVFFGDNVPRSVVADAFDRVDRASALLVVGSSLEVYSAFRFIERAVLKTDTPKPLAILNLGSTRAERAGAPAVKIELPCDEALWHVVTSDPAAYKLSSE